MLDKVTVIQNWYRNILDYRAKHSELAKETKAILVLQKFVANYLNRKHTKNLKNMQDSFDYFGKMRLILEIDSQIKIAYYWRKSQK